MKVLKKGRKQRGRAIQLNCTGKGNGGGGCGAKLLVSEYDMFKTYSHALHETDTYITFECPECGTATDVEKHRVAHFYIAEDKATMRKRKKELNIE